MISKPTIKFIEPRGTDSNVFARYMNIPMLGPLCLATIADRVGYPVEVLNENILGRAVKDSELMAADILCISSMTSTINEGRLIARRYRKLRTAAGLASRSIIGGIHASMMPEDVAGDFDQVFVGEAEDDFIPLLEGRLNGKIIHGRKLENLDSAPVPDFTLLRDYRKISIWPVMTSRGCPYDCNFCSVTEMFGRGLRSKSTARIIAEVQQVPPGKIFFVDDHFVASRKRTRALLQAMGDEGIRRSWSCQLRTEVSQDVELVRQMRAAGCRVVYIGLESVSDAALAEMNKKQTVADISRCIRVFRSCSINVHGMFIFGTDSDDPAIFDATSRFACASGLSTVQFMVLTPLPGTRLYRQLEEEGRILHHDWKYYDVMHVVHKPAGLSAAQLQEGMVRAYRQFYNLRGFWREAWRGALGTVRYFFSVRTRRYLPSILPLLFKVFGGPIIRRWVRQNLPYMHWLKVSGELSN